MIVDKEYQNRLIGTTLLKMILEKYKHVRMIQVNTDLYDRANEFYKSLGFKPLKDGQMMSYYK